MSKQQAEGCTMITQALGKQYVNRPIRLQKCRMLPFMRSAWLVQT
jgi:hypothetical protein